MQCIGKIYPP
uniref:Uncharacterized protein n=1 Tax=Arundo donax TaxID=35708 RepID=A0A0A9F721_ARUDO